MSEQQQERERLDAITRTKMLRIFTDREHILGMIKRDGGWPSTSTEVGIFTLLEKLVDDMSSLVEIQEGSTL